MKRQAKNSKKKIFVGLSGGVDSAVSAALLQKAGHEVAAVFIKVWQPDWMKCDWKEERLEAMRVAAHLNIPFITVDLSKEYKNGVVDYMIAEYSQGRTPNPDVMCNRAVKFDAFWQWAEKHGADSIATGHYAKIVGHTGSIKGSREYDVQPANLKLVTSADKNKDQSYFLWTLTQDDLSHVIFPVGDMNKAEVRNFARRIGLPNADKKDSQGLCFIGKMDFKKFLARYIKGNPAARPGKIINEKGQVIGTHPGSLFFTIGERHGFRIENEAKTPNDPAYYVVSKDIKNNMITVSNKEAGGFLKTADKTVKISRVNWVSGAQPSGGLLTARCRYRQSLEPITISRRGKGEYFVTFKKLREAISSGQSLVIYDGEACLGGGIIE